MFVSNFLLPLTFLHAPPPPTPPFLLCFANLRNDKSKIVKSLDFLNCTLSDLAQIRKKKKKRKLPEPESVKQIHRIKNKTKTETETETESKSVKIKKPIVCDIQNTIHGKKKNQQKQRNIKTSKTE